MGNAGEVRAIRRIAQRVGVSGTLQGQGLGRAGGVEIVDVIGKKASGFQGETDHQCKRSVAGRPQPIEAEDDIGAAVADAVVELNGTVWVL